MLTGPSMLSLNIKEHTKDLLKEKEKSHSKRVFLPGKELRLIPFWRLVSHVRQGIFYPIVEEIINNLTVNWSLERLGAKLKLSLSLTVRKHALVEDKMWRPINVPSRDDVMASWQSSRV